MERKSVDSELPSMASMGFQEKLEKSFPYHPMPLLIEQHFEILFSDYKKYRLLKRVPDFDTCLKKFWRIKFLNFIRKELKQMGVMRPTHYWSEEKFFQQYPTLLPKWQLQKAKHILLESRRDRFGRTVNDFYQHLQWQWLRDKKYEYMQRELGLREESYWREKTRRKCIDNYADTLLWCCHWECWTIRIKYFPFNFILYYLFVLYDILHPELLQIH